MEVYQVFDNTDVHIFATGNSLQKTRMENKHTEWFASWFDSPYYPMLYRHRDEAEAREALTNLHRFLALPQNAVVLDLCCGQGRHSRTLHALGCVVVGIDLSASAINHARSLAQPGQHFDVQDMRTFSLPERFDAVFNLFTSFGYFDSDSENCRVLNRIAEHLEPNGILVLDYLNAVPLLNQQVEKAEQTIDGVLFRTAKQMEGNSVVKKIEVTDRDKTYSFTEQVQLITLEGFTAMLQSCGFVLEKVFGNYQLEEYQPQESPRCLIIARKS
jgi:SAM-dependent methyltransferase